MAAPTESSRFWTTGGAGDGASTYTRDQLAEAFRNAFLGDPTLQGVFSGLAVSGASSPMTLAVGAACVYGYFYFCTVAGDVTKSTPAVGTTGFRVVLRAGWAAQTVRVAVVSSADGVSAIPAVTQTAGTTWEITLATGTITTGGVITLTDARAFCVPGPSQSALSVLGRSANTIGAMAPIVAASDGDVLRRSGTSIGFGQIATAGITDLAVTAAKIAAGTITANEIANRTRTFFMPAIAGYLQTVDVTPVGDGYYGSGPAVKMPDAGRSEIYNSALLPSDYASGNLTVKLICYSTVSANAYLTFRGSSVAAGADPFAAAEVLPGSAAFAITANTIMALTMTSTMAAAAADIITMSVRREADNVLDTLNTNFWVMGWLVSYTADS